MVKYEGKFKSPEEFYSNYSTKLYLYDLRIKESRFESALRNDIEYLRQTLIANQEFIPFLIQEFVDNIRVVLSSDKDLHQKPLLYNGLTFTLQLINDGDLSFDYDKTIESINGLLTFVEEDLESLDSEELQLTLLSLFTEVNRFRVETPDTFNDWGDGNKELH